MTTYEKAMAIMGNAEAVKTANELLAPGNLTWDEVVELTYRTHFAK